MKNTHILIILIIISIGMSGCQSTESTSNSSNTENNTVEEVDMKIVNIYVNEKSLEMELKGNDSAKEFYQKLKENDISILMNEYGDFEKVGPLGFSITIR